jgi:hypothetical protein
MEETTILGRDDESEFFKRVLGQYAAPAFMRRARRVQEAWDDLVAGCRRQRDEWLAMVRLRVGVLHGLAGDWTALRPLLFDDEQAAVLQKLYDELEPRLRMPVETTSSPRALKRALLELIGAIVRFNHRWRKFLEQLDLSTVNAARDGYNRYYVLEKECATRSPRVARAGFNRLASLTNDDVAALLPPLPIPRLEGSKS